MKKLMRMFLLASLTITAGTVWGISLDSFDYANQAALESAYTTTFAGDAGNCTTQLVLSTADKVEGTASMKVNFSFAAGQTYQYIYLTKNLTTPIDLSDAMRFSIWIKGDSALQNADPNSVADCIWLASLFGGNGYPLRYVDWNGSDLTTSSWHKVSWTITDNALEENPWNHFYQKPNLSNTSSIQISLMIEEASADSSSIYFDDWEYYNASSQVNAVNFDDFEGYATESALEANWKAYGNSVDTVEVQLSTTEKHAGSKSLNATLAINDFWMDCFISKELSDPIDMSNVRFVKFWLKGDTTSNSSGSNGFYMYFQDTTGSLVQGLLGDAINDEDWNCYIAELAVAKYNYPTYYILGPFNEYDWDPAGSTSTTDLKVINNVGFMYQYNSGSAPVPPLNFNIYFDDIVFLQSTTNDLVTNVSVINVAPSSAAIPITVSGGVAPYTWSLSTSALGTLSATSGASVTFTPGTVEIQGSLTITDSEDQTVVIPINLTPTLAPLAKDWALME